MYWLHIVPEKHQFLKRFWQHSCTTLIERCVRVRFGSTSSGSFGSVRFSERWILVRFIGFGFGSIPISVVCLYLPVAYSKLLKHQSISGGRRVRCRLADINIATVSPVKYCTHSCVAPVHLAFVTDDVAKMLKMQHIFAYNGSPVGLPPSDYTFRKVPLS